ncbi:MAG: bifunctional diaminohydroxyphosphoribosylaminopyrimidine deaminase/5-amino-6-(5-phosphoribosylamino)uracil reductase RibD [Gemmatimonadaceae bacterium]
MPEDRAALDNERMDRALVLAEGGWGQTSPNPMVGAVIFAGGENVGEGFHASFGGSHAETRAIAAAGDRARGATMYVNIEPCNHHGRNPPCVDGIIAAGISRVVVAARDPNPVAAGGAERLRSAGIEVDVGVRESEARELNAPFFQAASGASPWITLKLAMSLDGAIAAASRKRGWMTNEESTAAVHRMRANSDAIAVGILTAIADDPHLTARTEPPPRMNPVRVIFDRSARLPADSTLAKTAREIPTLLVTAPGVELPSELEDCGIESIQTRDVSQAIEMLKERGINSILVEGGAGLAASFIAGSWVDRLVIFRAPIVLGEGALNAFAGISSHEVEHAPRFDLLRSTVLGGDVMSVYSGKR